MVRHRSDDRTYLHRSKRKAFDIVDHEILCKNLYLYGVQDWKGFKSIIDLNASSASISPFLKDKNGTPITDPTQMANNFNDFFVNVANEITSKIPPNPKSPLSYLTYCNRETFPISPTTSDELSNINQSLVTGKCTEPNSIPIKLLKILDLCNSPHLSLTINKSFEEDIFPDNLKIAMVIPIFKW